MPIPVYKKKHKAAVKALGWSPLKRGYLATGSGTADRCLRVFDIT
jgi:cell division cycle 20-like protein 1 (cofactor of APC complex)